MQARTQWMALAAAGACAASAWAWETQTAPSSAAAPRPTATSPQAGHLQGATPSRISGLSGAAPSAANANANALPTTDVNGDGRSDLLLDLSGGTSFAYWEMAGAEVTRYSSVFERPSGYERIATADFSGDGRMDILWVNRFTRDVLLWVADGAGGFLQASAGQYTQEWRVTGAADFDGDGKADVLLQAGDNLAFWVMDGARVSRYSPVSVRTPGHVLVAKGDFNGDRKADLVWEVPESRELVMWLGDGNGFTAAPIRAYAQGWKVWGAGDVDGDGRSDLLLTHPSDRFFAYWSMNGATPVGYSPAFRLPGEASLALRYGPVAVGDYTGDGKLDVVLSRERDQALMLWRGDGSGFFETPMRRHTPGWQVARTFGAEGAPVRPYVPGDANGDGKADLFILDMFSRYDEATQSWHTQENGDNFHLLQDGPTRIGSLAPPRFRGQVLATGDFDGDVRQDIVIEEPADTQGNRRTFVRLSSRTPAYEIDLPTPVAGWRIVAAADVDGDGRSDLLLGEGSPASRHRDYASQTENPTMGGFAYWLMNRAVVTRYSAGFRTDPRAPRLAARGDFNGDGTLDVAWSNDEGAAPHLSIWLGDGVGFVPTGMNAPAPGWRVFGAGDIDADGRSDLLLDQPRGGGSFGWTGLAYWRMDGARVVEFSPGFLITGRDRGFADYNGDGRLDLLIVHDSFDRFTPRALRMWIGSGTGFTEHAAGGIRNSSFSSPGQAIFNR